MSDNGNKDPARSTFNVTAEEIIEFIEHEITQASAVREHLEKDSRSRRTWAATQRAYEKVLAWIMEHQH